jgi:high-affinity iron transporter
VLLDASAEGTTLVTLSGGGLQTPRTLTVRKGGASDGWQVSTAYRDAAVAELNAAARARTERDFWAIQLPIILAIIALLLAASAGRTLVQQRRRTEAFATASVSKSGRRAENSMTKGVTHAAH